MEVSIEGEHITWLSNKYSSIGRIDQHKHYYSLLYSTLDEDSWTIIHTLSSLSEINSKIKNFIAHDTFDNSLKDQQISWAGCKNDTCFEQKLSLMKFWVLHMEQTNKVLMMMYLLRISIDQRDTEDFSIIIEQLWYNR